MNCAACKDLLVPYLEGLLDDSEGQTVKEHIEDCVTCRTELEGLATLQRRLVGNGKALAHSDLEDDVMNRIFREQNARLKAAQAGAALRIRRLIMKSSIVKVAVAAAVILVCLAALSLWRGTDAGLALADVLAKVEKVQAFMYRMTAHMEGQTYGTSGADMEASILIANEQGMRMDVSIVVDPNTGRKVVQQIYMLPERKIMLSLMPEMKTYTRMEFDESMFEEARKKNNDPRMMIRQVLECKYQELGKSVIDGIEVEGFQTNDPAYMGIGFGEVDVKLWVDVKTWLPVRIDMHIKAGQQMDMQATMHDFQWDVPVDASAFNPVIPVDFTAGPGDGIRMPPMTEETAIAGLRLCVAFTGKYPEDLNLMTLMQMMGDFRDSQTPEAQKLRDAMDQVKTHEERAQVMVEPMMPIQMLGMFYSTLVQEKKEPAYHGDIVAPGDIAQVLLRWKTAENEYRVIFADLHAETVTAETLATLEAALPK